MLTPIRTPQAAMTIKNSMRLKPLIRPPLTGRSRGMIDERWRAPRESLLLRFGLRLREVVQ